MNLIATFSIFRRVAPVFSLAFIFSLFLLQSAKAQLSGTKTVCSSGCNYTSLSAAGGLFADINAVGLGGNLNVTINGDLLAEDGAVSLNNISVGSAFTITIKPNSLVLRTIATSLGNTIMINVNGADNLVIDGSYNGSGRYLLFRDNNIPNNTNSAIQFANGSTNVILSNSIIESNSSNALKPPVLVGAGTNQVTIDGCEIRPPTSGNTGNPVVGIRSNNSANTVTVINNIIYNFTATGIDLANVASGCMVGGNSIYSTVTATTTQTGINIGGTSSTGHTVFNNYIGGTAPLCAGTPWVNSSDQLFVGIKMNTFASAANSLQGNIIQNISLSNTGFNTNFYGMQLSTGNYDAGTVSGNTIGSPGTANSIVVAGEGATGTVGIRLDNSGTTIANISNNVIANISSTSGTYSIMSLRGIECSNSGGTLTISGNTIYSLNSASTVTSTTASAVTGIYLTGAAPGKTVSGNMIYNLLAGSTTGVTTAQGIYNAGGTSALISRNRIYDIRNLSTGTGNINGISLVNGDAMLSNNQITLTNASNTNPVTIRGVSSGGTHIATLYYNSIYVGGSAASGTANSYAWLYTSTSGNLLRNNILFNARTGGTGHHYTIANSSSSPTSWVSTGSNYNLLVASNSADIGLWNGTGLSFANWLTTSAGDANSWSTTTASLSPANFFVSPGTGDLDIIPTNPEAWYANGRGVQIIGQTEDYSNPATGRSQIVTNGAPDIGADEMVPSSTPPAPTVTGTIAVGNTQTFSFAGRTLGAIQWTAGSVLPLAISWLYHPGTNPPLNLNNHYSNAYWTIAQTAGINFTYTLTLNYDPAILGTAVEPSLQIAKKAEAATNWLSYGTSTVNTTNKTVTLPGLTSFSNFTLSDAIAPLPIELQSFTADVVNTAVKLRWDVGYEAEINEFEIQRSNDGGTFSKIASVPATGSNMAHDYLDETAVPGINYYRLRMPEKNGGTRYSKIVMAIISDKSGIIVYPNPFLDKLSIESQKVQSGEIALTDISGKVIRKTDFNGKKMVLDVTDLPKGNYLLKYSDGDKEEVFKLTK